MIGVIALLVSLWPGVIAVADSLSPSQSEITAAHDRIHALLISIFSRVPNEAFSRRGIAEPDIDRAKECSVKALMADIPDDALVRIVELLGQNPVPRDRLIEHWLFPDLRTDVERRDQINAQVAKICPEFREQLKEL